MQELVMKGLCVIAMTNKQKIIRHIGTIKMKMIIDYEQLCMMLRKSKIAITRDNTHAFPVFYYFTRSKFWKRNS